jgi:hypothetical protein
MSRCDGLKSINANSVCQGVKALNASSISRAYIFIIVNDWKWNRLSDEGML